MTRTVTPPLLPLSPGSGFQEDLPLMCVIEKLSDPVNPDSQRARNLESAIMAEDVLLPIQDSMLFNEHDVDELDKSPGDLIFVSSTPPKRKLNSLKIEGPLTPPLLLDSTYKRAKSVPFCTMLHEYTPKPCTKLASIENPSESLNEVGVDIDHELGRFAQAVTKELRNEKLIEADSTRRVRVPDLSPIQPRPPWQPCLISEQSLAPTLAKNLVGRMTVLVDSPMRGVKRPRSWHGQTGLDRKLSWTPFPSSLGKADLNEPWDTDITVLPNLMEIAPLSEIRSSSDCVGKPEELRILCNTWEDEDIPLKSPQLAENEECNEDLDYLVRIKSRTIDQAALIESKCNHTTIQSVGEPPFTASLPSADSDAAVCGAFSASVALADFLMNRGHEKIQAKETVKLLPNHDQTNALNEPLLAPKTSVQQRLIDGLVQEDITSFRLVAGSPRFSVRLPKEIPPRTIIVSSHILATSRTLSREIVKLSVHMTLIERDFAALKFDTLTSTETQSIGVENVNALADEGDFVISPSTSVILTTIQKIKQRPLPGQTIHGGIRERLSAVRLRFEHIIVFVSGGSSFSTRNGTAMDERDAAALVDLQAFSAAFETNIQVCYVPGNDQELATWITSAICKYGFEPAPKGEFSMLEVESLWEHFLRRVGFNAYAAQVILNELKYKGADDLRNGLSIDEEFRSSVQDDIGCGTVLYGLSEFILMSPQERTTRFAHILSGVSALNRANVVIDGMFRSRR